MPHSTYFAHRMGHAEISPQGEFEAGSFQSFTLTYTAGYFGIDDTGSLKIVHRFASDMGRPQFNDPKGWNYTTVEASNGAVLWRYAPLKVAHRYTFDAGPAVRAFLQRCPAAIVAVELDGVGYRLTAPFPEGELPGETTVADLAQLLAEPASRVIVRDAPSMSSLPTGTLPVKLSLRSAG